INLLPLHHRERVDKTVISNMISERAVGCYGSEKNLPADENICINAYAIPFFIIAIREASFIQNSCTYQFADIFRQGHYRCHRMCRRSADKYAYLKRYILGSSLLLVHANAPMQLIMQPCFFV